ncbi:MAG: SPOR domain-containing protein [Bdellovibrionales bacterium]|nr:SPOR domain-containing protein [Bdellovibrionales bacterium]
MIKLTSSIFFMSRQTALRFDHKEIAVIFALFVFVAMLMFTVGILVGKGLTTARLEADGFGLTEREPAGLATQVPKVHSEGLAESHGSTVTSGHAGLSDLTEPSHSEASAGAFVENTVPATAEPLKLIPKKTTPYSPLSDSLLEKKHKQDSDHVFQNPKVNALLESGARAQTASRQPNALPTAPVSFGEGAYTVQIGSYPNKQDAEARIESLKKLGFPHAYLSAKQLGEKKATWFRVWLGYFPNFDTAKENAEFLKQKGEVKNYLVRKSDQNKG